MEWSVDVARLSEEGGLGAVADPRSPFAVALADGTLRIGPASGLSLSRPGA